MSSKHNTSVILGSNGEQLYEVEAIRTHKGSGKKRLYQIKWKGYPESDNTWEPIQNLQNILKYVREYEKAVKQPSKSTAIESASLKSKDQSTDPNFESKDNENTDSVSSEIKTKKKYSKKAPKVVSSGEVSDQERTGAEDNPYSKHKSPGKNEKISLEEHETSNNKTSKNDKQTPRKNKSLMNLLDDPSKDAIEILGKRKKRKIDYDLMNDPSPRKKRQVAAVGSQNEKVSASLEATPKKNMSLSTEKAYNLPSKNENTNLMGNSEHKGTTQTLKKGSEASPIKDQPAIMTLQKAESLIQHNLKKVLDSQLNSDPMSLLEKIKRSTPESDSQKKKDKTEGLLKNLDSLVNECIELESQEGNSSIKPIEKNNNNTDSIENKTIIEKKKPEQEVPPFELSSPLQKSSSTAAVITTNQRKIDDKSKEEQVDAQTKKPSLDIKTLKKTDNQDKNMILEKQSTTQKTESIKKTYKADDSESDEDMNFQLKKKKIIQPQKQSSRRRSSSKEKKDKDSSKHKHSKESSKEHHHHHHRSSKHSESSHSSSQIKDSHLSKDSDQRQSKNTSKSEFNVPETPRSGSQKDIYSRIIKPDTKSTTEPCTIPQTIVIEKAGKSSGNQLQLSSMLDENRDSNKRRNQVSMMVESEEQQKTQIEIENEQVLKILNREAHKYQKELTAGSLVNNLEDDDDNSSCSEEESKNGIVDIQKDLITCKGLSQRSIRELKIKVKDDYLTQFKEQLRKDKLQNLKILKKKELNINYFSLDFKQLNKNIISFSNPKQLKQQPTSSSSNLSQVPSKQNNTSSQNTNNFKVLRIEDSKNSVSSISNSKGEQRMIIEEQSLIFKQRQREEEILRQSKQKAEEEQIKKLNISKNEILSKHKDQADVKENKKDTKERGRSREGRDRKSSKSDHHKHKDKKNKKGSENKENSKKSSHHSKKVESKSRRSSMFNESSERNASQSQKMIEEKQHKDKRRRKYSSSSSSSSSSSRSSSSSSSSLFSSRSSSSRSVSKNRQKYFSYSQESSSLDSSSSPPPSPRTTKLIQKISDSNSKQNSSKNITLSRRSSSISNGLIQRNNSSSQQHIKQRDGIKESQKDIKLTSMSSIEERSSNQRQISDKVENRYEEEQKRLTKQQVNKIEENQQSQNGFDRQALQQKEQMKYENQLSGKVDAIKISSKDDQQSLFQATVSKATQNQVDKEEKYDLKDTRNQGFQALEEKNPINSNSASRQISPLEEKRVTSSLKERIQLQKDKSISDFSSNESSKSKNSSIPSRNEQSLKERLALALLVSKGKKQSDLTKEDSFSENKEESISRFYESDDSNKGKTKKVMVVKKVISKKPIELVKHSDKFNEFGSKDSEMGLRKEPFFREMNFNERSSIELEEEQKILHEQIQNSLIQQQQEQEQNSQNYSHQEQQLNQPTFPVISNSQQCRLNNLQSMLEKLQDQSNCNFDIPQQIISHVVVKGQLFFQVTWNPREKGDVQIAPSFIESLKLQQVNCMLFNQYVWQMLATPTKPRQ